MSKRYENVLKKAQRKVKRVGIPKTIGDYMDNLSIDLKNYHNRARTLEKLLMNHDGIPDNVLTIMDKLRWYGFQITDNYAQIVKILRERGIYKSVRDKEQL